MQTLRVEDTDPRLEFGPNGAWTIQGDYHYSETDSSRFFILFRGQYQTLLRFLRVTQPLNSRNGNQNLWSIWE